MMCFSDFTKVITDSIPSWDYGTAYCIYEILVGMGVIDETPNSEKSESV